MVSHEVTLQRCLIVDDRTRAARLKEIAGDVGVRPSARHDVLPSSWTATDQLLFDIVSWSSAEYYGGDGR
jgi:hypothetical protein